MVAPLLVISLTRLVIRSELVRDEPIQERIDFVYDASVRGPKSTPMLIVIAGTHIIRL